MAPGHELPTGTIPEEDEENEDAEEDNLLGDKAEEEVEEEEDRKLSTVSYTLFEHGRLKSALFFTNQELPRVN
jgi:hypothetical protein